MKNLLQKTINQLTTYAFIVFALSVPSYYFLVDWIWLKELDENNQIIAERIENEFNEQSLKDKKLAEHIAFWNEIQPNSKIISSDKAVLQDSLYTISRKKSYSKEEIINRFRGLKKPIKINNQNYQLIVETNVEETEETVAYIAMVSLLFFMILVIGFWILNKKLSKKLWEPFQDTLQKLKSFKLNSQKTIDFKQTSIIEFAELNETLDKLIKHNIAVYQNQKEFTENASHELQTPLSILKNKLDVFLQTNDLTEKQYQIAEEMNKALLRSSLINKNLLLLSKIENNQFENTEVIALDILLNQITEGLEEHFIEKKLNIHSKINENVTVRGNVRLVEVLVNNLIYNAIRHTFPGGIIVVELTEKGFEIRNTGQKTLDNELLFKRFSKISNNNGGIGLGLSIVKEIAHFHGWEVGYKFENNEHIFYVLL